MLRSDIETVIIARIGKILTFVGLDGTTKDGTNVDLNDPIADALETQSLTPISRIAIADADTQRVATGNSQWFLRDVELRALYTVLNQFIYYSETFVDNTERIIEVRQGVEKRVDCLEKEIKHRWGDKAAGFYVGQAGTVVQGSPGTGVVVQPWANVNGGQPLVDLSKFIL